MSRHDIKRVVIHPCRIPVPKERILCSEFMYEPLNRGPNGRFDGPYFGDVPTYIVEVQGNGGPAGWGDMPRIGEIDDLKLRASKLIGKSPQDIHVEHDPTDDPRQVRGIHTAALDWRCRIEEIPLWAMFGQMVRDRVKVSWWTAFRTPKGAAEIATHARSLGINSLKLKGNEVLDDVGIAIAVREAYDNDNFLVIIDPNGRWGDADKGIERARRIREVTDSVWLEDPVRTDHEGVARVRREANIGMIRTCRGGADHVHKIVSAGAADGLNIGGKWPVMLEASTAAEKNNLPFWVGSSVMSGLSDFASLHFAATQPNFLLGADLAASQSREHNLIKQPLTYDEGTVTVPQSPGLGVDVDLDAIEKYRIADPIRVE